MRMRAAAPVGTILAPAQTLRDLADGPRSRGRAPVIALGVAWSLLSLALGIGGHQPSGPVPWPFEADGYYLRQAVFLPFLLYGLWHLLTRATDALARGLGGVRIQEGLPSDALGAVLGYAWAVPILVSLVLPDLLILWWAGFEGLSKAMLYYAPLTLLWTLALCTLGVRVVYGFGWVRALTAALGGLLAQALVGGIWIR